jgi:uncharacterized membrane protein YfcA
LVFGIPSAMGAIIGALSLVRIPEIVIVVFISIIAGVFGIRILIVTFRSERDDTDETETKEVSTSQKIWNKLNSLKPIIHLSRNDKTLDISLPLVASIGLFVGVLAGLFGVGGGWIQVPIFIIFFGLDPLIASGTSLLIITLKAIAGSVTYIAMGNIAIDWWIILALVVGFSIGAFIGNWLKGVIKIRYISYIVGSALLFIVASTIITAAIGYL